LGKKGDKSDIEKELLKEFGDGPTAEDEAALPNTGAETKDPTTGTHDSMMKSQSMLGSNADENRES